MATTFHLPDLGENVDGGEVLRVLIAAGDSVREDQPVLELETGKATVEVPAGLSGSVTEVLVKPGDHIEVGGAVYTVEAGEAATASPAEESPGAPVPEEAPTPEPIPEPSVPSTSPAAASEAVEFLLPDLGESVEEGDVISIFVSSGDVIEVDQPVLEIETGKATVEVPSSISGTVARVHIVEGSKIRVGQSVMTVSGATGPVDTLPSTPPPAPSQRKASWDVHEEVQHPPRGPQASYTRPDAHVPVRAAPSVRRFARELGIDIYQVPPSGEGLRVTQEDVKAHAKQRLTTAPADNSSAPPSSTATPLPALPDFSQWGPVKREKMSGIRRLTAEHMTRCWTTIPHVTQHDSADLTDLEAARKRLGPRVEQSGGKLTLTAILLKLTAGALKSFPQFNASLDTASEEIIYKERIHIGIAVDTPRGLLVPVIRDVDRKNITELALELTALAVRARDGKISPDDLQGGGFSISNLGGIGGGHFTPIVNWPEVAILGVGRGSVQAVHREGSFVPRLMLPLSLSYDHRLIDGADGARFIRWIAEAVADPMILALEG